MSGGLSLSLSLSLSLISFFVLCLKSSLTNKIYKSSLRLLPSPPYLPHGHRLHDLTRVPHHHPRVDVTELFPHRPPLHALRLLLPAPVPREVARDGKVPRRWGTGNLRGGSRRRRGQRCKRSRRRGTYTPPRTHTHTHTAQRTTTTYHRYGLLILVHRVSEQQLVELNRRRIHDRRPAWK